VALVLRMMETSAFPYMRGSKICRRRSIGLNGLEAREFFH
jgi:hypothetical protein